MARCLCTSCTPRSKGSIILLNSCPTRPSMYSNQKFFFIGEYANTEAKKSFHFKVLHSIERELESKLSEPQTFSHEICALSGSRLKDLMVLSFIPGIKTTLLGIGTCFGRSSSYPRQMYIRDGQTRRPGRLVFDAL